MIRLLNVACVLGLAAITAACPDRRGEAEGIAAHRHERAFGEADDTITLRVRSALSADERIEDGIEVATKDGVVRLTGVVPDENTKQRAGEVARDVEGVREVRNDLMVAGERR